MNTRLFVVALVLACVGALNAQTFDTLTFGDAASESAHALVAPLSQTVTGGLGQTARVLLPPPQQDVYGGEMVFTMAVDPVAQNYFTAKLWGADTGSSWLILNCNGREIGGRHGAVGLGEDPLYFTGGAWYANRFIYRTVPLPLAMTRGQSSVTMRIRSSGTIFYYAPIFTYVPQYQRYMAAPTPGVYKAYTHAGSLVDVSGETQGTAPTVPTPRTTENETTALANVKSGVNTSLSNNLTAAATSLGQTDAEFLAQCYDAKTNAGATWIAYPSGKTDASIGAQITAVLDALVTAYAADNTQAAANWGGNYAPMGDAVRLAWPLISGSMSATVAYGGTLGTVTRQAGWSAALRASVDAGRFNRQTIGNQSMINGANIYYANRALLLVDPTNALNESEAVRYMKEAWGVLPWMGSDLPGGGAVPVRGTQPYGPNWYMCTTKGTSKDGDGFVGSDYGEISTFGYRMGLLANDSQLQARALLMARARCVFRYPSVDESGFFNLQGTDPIGERNNDLPSHYVYLGRGTPDDFLTASQGAAAIGNDLLGAFQQGMNDGQMVRNFTNDPYLPTRWAAIKTMAQTNVKMPMSPGQPDFAWVDEENMVVAAKHGEERFFANLYWRQPGFINGLAKVFHLTPTTAHLGDVMVDDVRFKPNGLSYVIDTPVDTFATPVDNPVEAFAGWPTLQALRSDVPDNTIFSAGGDTNRDLGRGTGYTFRYGNWLVGINGHYTDTDTYTMPLPSDFTSATDLISGTTKSGPVVLAPKTSVVFYLPTTAPAGGLPARALYIAAASGNGRIAVSWNPAGGATSYKVLRSTTSGGGYAMLASGVTGVSYIDTTAANGTAYYYVVQSVNASGPSGNSPEASATPVAPQTAGLSAPWNDLDLGSSTGGSASLSGGTCTVKSGPGDIYGTADGCHLVYQPMFGDGTVLAKVQSQSSANTYAKAGLAIRSSLAAGATRIAIVMEKTGRAEYDYRTSDGGGTSNVASASGLTLPYWVRITRRGVVVSGYISADGTNWTLVGSTSVTALPACAYVGLVVSPANSGTGQTNTGVFSNVSFPLGASAAPTTPTGLAAIGGENNVGLSWTAVPGAVSYHVKRASSSGGPFVTAASVSTDPAYTDYGQLGGTNVYYVVSAVNDFGESPDSTAVSAMPNAPPAAVTGLTATAGASQVNLAWNAVPGATSYTVRRGTQYGVVGTVLASGLTGTSFVDNTAASGTTYVYSVSASIGGSEGQDTEVDATAPGLPSPWFTQDIGTVNAAGAGYSADGVAFTVKGSGADIWNQADEFRCVYRTVTGDADLVARVNTMTSTGVWAKAGVMIRNTTDANSAYALMMVTPGNGVSFQKRMTVGASASVVATTGGIVAPYWVRITRAGNTVTAYSSATGASSSWVQLGAAQTLSFNASYLIGLAVTSTSDGTLCTANFDNVQLNGVPPSAPTALGATASNHAVALAWTAPANVASYNVKRSTTSGSGYTTLASGVTGTAYTDTTAANGTPYYYVVSGVNSVGEGANSNEAAATPVALAGPVALYHLEGNVNDASGNANNGTATSVTYAVGTVGAQGASFNGTSSYVRIPAAVSTSFTVAMWVKTTGSNTGTQWYSGKGLVDGYVKKNGADWGTSVLGGKFAFGVGNTDTTITSSATITDGNWHHLAATRDNTSGAMCVYVDGILGGSGTGPTGTRSATTTLRLGSLQTGANFFSGTMDEVCLYNRVLGASEIAALANAPSALSATPGNATAALAWNASSPYVSSYNVKRATVLAGPYSTLASVIGTGTTDTGLTNGTPYYYVVSAVDSGVETPNSAPASVTPQMTYAVWKARYFTAGQQSNPAISGVFSDPNGDGITNLVAYAFNLNPWANISGALPLAQISNGYLTITYVRRKAPADITYAVAISNDLVNWQRGTTYTTELSVTSLDAETDAVTVRTNAPVGVGAQFIRVEISN